MKIDLGHGAPTYVASRRDNGVTIHQGASHIMLAPDELAAVLAAIHTLTQSGPTAGSEKMNSIGHPKKR